MTKPEMVLNTAPEAAKRVTLTGWVSRTGRFYGDDERLARWDGATHLVCECGRTMTKTYIKCDVCRSTAECARHAARPVVDWDGVTPFCEADGDQFFFDEEQFYDWCDEHELQPDEVPLLLCKPQYLRQVSEEYWADDLPEDADTPDDLLAALNVLNTAIAAYNLKHVASWVPSGKRIVMPTIAPPVSDEPA